MGNNSSSESTSSYPQLPQEELEIRNRQSSNGFRNFSNSLNQRHNQTTEPHSESRSISRVTSDDFGISMTIFFVISFAIFFTFLFARNPRYKNYIRNNGRDKLDYVLKISEYETRGEYPSHVNIWVAVSYLFLGIIISVGLHFILMGMDKFTYYVIYGLVALCYIGVAIGIFQYPYKGRYTKTETVDESGKVIKTEYWP